MARHGTPGVASRPPGCARYSPGGCVIAVNRVLVRGGVTAALAAAFALGGPAVHAQSNVREHQPGASEVAVAQADPTTGHHIDVDDKNVIPQPRPKALDDPDAG